MRREKFKGDQRERPVRLRLATGSLQDLSARQLATLTAEAARTLKSRWLKDNRPPTPRGRPSGQAQVFAACARIHKGMRRRKHASLSDWYRTVETDLRARSIELSDKTRRKFIRTWLHTHLPFECLPEGLGPYLINTQKNFSSVQWILIWGGLCQQFPEVRKWLEGYKCQHGVLPGELPHEILPHALQDKLNRRLDFPLGPRCYGLLIREPLRNAPEE